MILDFEVPEGMDFTVQRDGPRWLLAIWAIGDPGGGIHTHGYGETLDKAVNECLMSYNRISNKGKKS